MYCIKFLFVLLKISCHTPHALYICALDIQFSLIICVLKNGEVRYWLYFSLCCKSYVCFDVWTTTPRSPVTTTTPVFTCPRDHSVSRDQRVPHGHHVHHKQPAHPLPVAREHRIDREHWVPSDHPPHWPFVACDQCVTPDLSVILITRYCVQL